MKRTAFDHMPCPVARSLERVGEWWAILILRDAFYGLTRFDEFQASLGIATSTLARRLDALVASGLLERRRYCARPPRDEYLLTEVGRDFRPVMLALLGWGNRHFAPEGPSVELVDRTTGARIDPVLVDRATGHPVTNAHVVAGPAADAAVRRRFERVASGASAPASRPDGRDPRTVNPRTGRPIAESHLVARSLPRPTRRSGEPPSAPRGRPPKGLDA